MQNTIDYSNEVNTIKRLAPSASRYNFRSGGSRVNTAALRKLSENVRSLRQKCQNAIVAWCIAAILTAQRSTHQSGEAPPQSSVSPLAEKNCAGV